MEYCTVCTLGTSKWNQFFSQTGWKAARGTTCVRLSICQVSDVTCDLSSECFFFENGGKIRCLGGKEVDWVQILSFLVPHP